jgi:carboxypeptidase T
MAPSPSRLPAAVLAFSSFLWLASCAPESSQSWSSLLDAPRERTLLVHISYGTEERLARLSEELDLLEHADRAAGIVDALVGEETYARLEKEGLAVEVDKEQTALLDEMASMSTMSIPGYACYRTVEETSASMTQLATTYPNLVTVVDIGDTYEKVTPGGNPGYDLQVLVATNKAIPGPKPRFFLMGAIHAREYTTAEVAMRFAETLLDGYGKDPDATWLLDQYELHVLPITNPDGRKLAEQGYLQRKNRHPAATAPTRRPTPARSAST